MNSVAIISKRNIFGRSSPLWNGLKRSDHAAQDGLWLGEPRAGFSTVGAKREEILVIEDRQAPRLDSNPLHVRQRALIAAGDDYSPAVLRAA